MGIISASNISGQNCGNANTGLYNGSGLDAAATIKVGNADFDFTDTFPTPEAGNGKGVEPQHIIEQFFAAFMELFKLLIRYFMTGPSDSPKDPPLNPPSNPPAAPPSRRPTSCPRMPPETPPRTPPKDPIHPEHPRGPNDAKERVLFVTSANSNGADANMAHALDLVEQGYRGSGVNVDFEAITNRDGTPIVVSSLGTLTAGGSGTYSLVKSEEIKALMKEYGADNVVYVGNERQSGTLGIAYIGKPGAIVHDHPNMANLAYILGHELGHNYGLKHTWQDGDGLRGDVMDYGVTSLRLHPGQVAIVNRYV
jgi:hypothetical protein